MPRDTRGGMIMNKVVAILSLVIIAGGVHPDLPWAHSHVLALTEDRGLLRPAEFQNFIGPVLNGEGLSQRGEQPSRTPFSLIHTDIHYLPGSGAYHPAPSRSFIAPDGVALMFSWPFASVSTFQMSPEGSSNEPTLNRDRTR